MTPIRYRTPRNHKNIILKVIFLFYLKAFSKGQKWSLIGKNYFIVLKIFDKNLGKFSGHILSIYKSFNTWSCSKYWSNPSKTLSGYSKLLKYLQRKYSLKIPWKFCHVTNALFGDLVKSHVLEKKLTSSNPLKTISVHFEVWATLHCQTSPNVLKPCENAQMV